MLYQNDLSFLFYLFFSYFMCILTHGWNIPLMFQIFLFCYCCLFVCFYCGFLLTPMVFIQDCAKNLFLLFSMEDIREVLEKYLQAALDNSHLSLYHLKLMGWISLPLQVHICNNMCDSKVFDHITTGYAQTIKYQTNITDVGELPLVFYIPF